MNSHLKLQDFISENEKEEVLELLSAVVKGKASGSKVLDVES